MAAKPRGSSLELSSKPIVLVVEDDVNMQELVANLLHPLDAEVVTTPKPQNSLDYLENDDVAVVVTDLKMPGISGMDVLQFAKQCNPLTQVVVITGYATVESAVGALKAGAYDYLRKPFEPDELTHTVGRALEHYVLRRDNLRLRARNELHEDSFGLVGRTPAMEDVRRLIEASAGHDCSVLITGESGVGKELVARQIHMKSARHNRRFVALNCAAIPENIVESELFGYKKGAFTGADRNKPGLFETADGGTLFLDEINNASLSLQVKLLRVLEDGHFLRVGETDPRHADVRILVASNRDLPGMIEAGQFREDLYYRSRVIEINLPPLRDRRSDIPLLANYFVGKISTQLRKPIKGITARALSALLRHDWPGNVRELENALKRMIILTEAGKIDVDVLPQELTRTTDEGKRALDFISPQSLEEIEAYFIAKTLRETNGNRSLAADILGIDKSTLWRKIKRYKLDC